MMRPREGQNRSCLFAEHMQLARVRVEGDHSASASPFRLPLYSVPFYPLPFHPLLMTGRRDPSSLIGALEHGKKKGKEGKHGDDYGLRRKEHVRTL